MRKTASLILETTAACTSGDDCCVYCDPSSWTCAGSTTACIASGCEFPMFFCQNRSSGTYHVCQHVLTSDFVATGLSSNDCCSGAYSSGSTCA